MLCLHLVVVIQDVKESLLRYKKYIFFFFKVNFFFIFIFKTYDEGTTEKPYAHCLVAGIDRYPRKVTRKMGKNKIAKRSKVKPFIRVFNLNHLMPTR